MDKYEYNLKLDQIKTLFSEENYDSAAEIADTINWNKIKNVNALVKAGEVYEKVERYQDSRDVLLMAYDRSPIGRMIIYRLAEVAIKMKDFSAAEEYYTEFVEIAPHDNLKFVLKYDIQKSQGASYDVLIPILEDFKEQEYTEEWAYELAYLYHKAGKSEKCIEACDELILWFGDGPYVERALELKMLYQPLSKVQEEKYRRFRQEKAGLTVIGAEEMRRAGEIERESVAIPPIAVPVERFSTINLQQEIAKGMQQIMDATEKETVSDTMDNIKKIVEEIPYLQIERENEESVEMEHIVTDEEIDGSLKIDFQEMLEEESDGQMSLLTNDKYNVERQITGQLSIADVLEEWEKTRRAAEAALQVADQRKLESAKARALHEAEDIMERLNDVIPKLDAGVTPKELLEEEYLQKTGDAADTKDEGMNSPTIELPTLDIPKFKVPPVAQIVGGINNGLEDATVGADTASITAAMGMVKPGINIDRSVEEETEAEPVVEIEEEAEAEPVVEIEEEAKAEPVVEIEEKAEAEPVAEIEEEVETESVSEIEKALDELQTLDRSSMPSIRMGDTKDISIDEALLEAELAAATEIVIDLDNPGSDKKEEPEEQQIEESKDDLEDIELVKIDISDLEKSFYEETEAEVEVPEVVVQEPEEKELTAEEKLAKEILEKSLTNSFRPIDIVEDLKLAAQLDEIDSVGEQFNRINSILGDQVSKITAEDPEIEEKLAFAATQKLPTEELLKELGEYEAKPEEKETVIEELSEEQKAMFSYFIPVKGMEKQLSRVVSRISKHLTNDETAATGNLIVQGEQGCGKTVLASCVIKVLHNDCGKPGKKIGKIPAESINGKDLHELVSKIAGGNLIIESAGNLDKNTVSALSVIMEKDKSGTLYVLEDTAEGIKKVLSLDEGFASKFTEKITVPIFTNDELVAFARSYSRELGYEIEEMAVLALHNRISNIEKLDQATTLTEVKEIVDEAIKKEAQMGIQKFFSILTAKRYTDDDKIVLTERNFEE